MELMTNHSDALIVNLFVLFLSWLSQHWAVMWLWWHAFFEKPGEVVPVVRMTVSSNEPAECSACKEESVQAKQEREAPARIEQKRGRQRSVDTSAHFCPNPACDYYEWVGLGNIRSNGHPNGGRWRQLECTVCHKTFVETLNTIFYGKKHPAETIWRVLTSLAEGVGIRKTARIFDLDPNTVQEWLRQAGVHTESVSHYLLHNLHLTQVQVDELWAHLGKRDGEEKATAWVWVGVDAPTKLWLATIVGDRSQTCAQLLIHDIVALLTPGCMPLFTSDQWSAYGTALLTHFGQWVETQRQHTRGRPPKPRWLPLPELLYAQVVKQREHGRVVSVSKRIIFGFPEVIEKVLRVSGISQVINTAFVERLNLTIREHVAALGRKVQDIAKSISGLRNQLSLAQAYHNFCLPHSSLRRALPHPIPTRGNGSPKKWQLRTPAMAAGITDHIWRMEELLLLRVPSTRQNNA
jgi:IS1 family transposase/transposase-like protein